MAKGSDFERQMCVELSLWWTEGRRDDVFWRSSNSGGRATVRARRKKKTSGQHGDVAALDNEGRPLIDFCVIELKRGYNTATIHALLDAPANSATQDLDAFITQAKTAAWSSGAPHWMVIHRRDRRLPIVWIPKSLAEILREYGPLPCGVAVELVLPESGPTEIFGCILTKFLMSVRPNWIKAEIAAQK